MPGTEQPLLERDAELATLSELVEQARAGSGALAVIEGPAGIGKTRLIQASRRRAADAGLQVLGARAGELEQDFPFGVVRQLFEPRLAEASDAERAQALAGAADRARAVLDGEMPLEPSAPGGATFAVLHGLYWLAANLAALTPAVITVDDAHWADPASMRFLTFLVHRLEGLPIALVLAARTGGTARDDELLAQLLSDGQARRLRPSELSEQAVDSLVRQQMGVEPDPEFCAACHRASGGNPFLVRELLTELASERVDPRGDQAERVRELTPHAVRRAVLLRLGRLPDPAPALARALSILGDEADLRQLSTMSGAGEADVPDALDALTAAEILGPGRPPRFAHPMIRAAIYAELPGAQRGREHARAARVLAEGGVSPDRVAANLMAAEPSADPWVVQTLRDAGRGALARGAPDAAVSYLRRALDEPPAPEDEAEVLRELGFAESAVAPAGAVEHLEQAVMRAPDAIGRGRAVLALAHALVLVGRARDAAGALEQEIEAVGDADAGLARQLEAELVNTALMDLSLRPLLLARLERFDSDEAGADPADRALLATLALETTKAGKARDKAVELAERALGSGEPNYEDVSFFSAVYTLIIADHFDAARDWIGRAMLDARARGSVAGFIAASLGQTTVRYYLGSMADTEADARSALEAGLAHGWYAGLPQLLGALIDALVERGELAAADAELQGRSLDGELPAGIGFLALQGSRGRLRLKQGRPGDALADLLLQGERAIAWGGRNPAAVPWRSNAALAHTALGALDDARSLADEEVSLARAWGAPRALSAALRVGGVVTGGERGIELLLEADAVAQGSPALLTRARALVDLGAALRRAGKRADARAPLRDGLDLAGRCGATALVDFAHEELLAAGGRPQRLAFSGVDALTPSERRVAQLATEGMTNREIAQALFVTLKTVEMHLSNAYRKLGIRSRSQLADALSAAPQP